MDTKEVRLEVLKLAFRHDRQPAQVITDAKSYEQYILEEEPGQALPAPQVPSSVLKKGKKATSLSAEADILS